MYLKNSLFNITIFDKINFYIFRAGSRNETYSTQGIIHHLRIYAGLSTSRSSTFGITRNIQQLGGNLTATTDRESIAYTLQITRDKL